MHINIDNIKKNYVPTKTKTIYNLELKERSYFHKMFILSCSYYIVIMHVFFNQDTLQLAF